jgi:hypothetical protein
MTGSFNPSECMASKAVFSDLAGRLAKRVQVSSDSLPAYADAMERGFGTQVDYGQISKTFAFENLTKKRGWPLQPGGSCARG